MTRKAIPLSKERQAWAKRFKPDVVSRGTTLEYSAASAARYQRAIDKLIARMAKDVESSLKKLYKSKESKEYFTKDSAMDASISSQSRILTNRLQKKYEKIFQDEGKDIAKQMLGAIETASAASLSISLKELSGGLTINASMATGDVQDVVKASV